MKHLALAILLALVACSSSEDTKELDTARTQAQSDLGCSDVNVTKLPSGDVEASGCSQTARYTCTRDPDFWSCARVYGQ